MRRLVFPQTWGYLIPSLTNQCTGLIKECSVLSVITVPEVAMAAQFFIGETFSPIEGYFMVSMLYWALTGAVSWALWVLWRRKNAARLARPQALSREAKLIQASETAT
jgi:ABC-type amino acid transport system permease subunit